MSHSSPRFQPPGDPGAGPSPSSVRVVVEGDQWSRQFSGAGSETRGNPSGVRLAARIVFALVFASAGLALFDLYLLLSGLQ
jgi:hypothetical protein